MPPLTLVTPPLAAVVAVAALPPMLKPAAVPVMFVPTKTEGVPSAGVTKVGLFDRTTLPVPVEAVTPVPPFATGKVPVTPVVSGRPVTLVITPLAGVPSAGVTKVGPLDNTLLPEPVDVVTPVPPLATGSVPVTPVANGSPVTLVIKPLAGVPSTGATKVGLLDSTLLPLPVEVVTPEPPLATGKVPVVPPSIGKPVALVNVALVGVPKAGVTSVGELRSAFVAIAVEMLTNSVLISVPLTILSGSPDGSASLVAKFVLCV